MRPITFFSIFFTLTALQSNGNENERPIPNEKSSNFESYHRFQAAETALGIPKLRSFSIERVSSSLLTSELMILDSVRQVSFSTDSMVK